MMGVLIVLENGDFNFIQCSDYEAACKLCEAQIATAKKISSFTKKDVEYHFVGVVEIGDFNYSIIKNLVDLL